MNVFFFNQGRDVGDLRIWRSADQPAFGPRELTLLNALTPYFQQALSVELPLNGALSPRERAVVEHVAAGRSDKEIASLMSIGFTTVRTHLKNAITATRIDLRKRCRCSCADSGDQIIGVTAALEPDGVTIQQSQNRLKVAGHDGLINIEVTAFAIAIERLDRTQMCRSSVVSAVPQLELNVDERR